MHASHSPSRSRTRSVNTAAVGFVASAIVCGAAGVDAREGVDVIEEVLVTAQKRQENIQDVPISITAFSADDLADRNIIDLTDLAQAVPNLNYVSDGTLKNNAPSIRGVTNPSAGNAGMDSPLAVYIDEVYMGNNVGQHFDLFDIERVEVLRGPQGTLFGRNALGGLINIITPTPGNDIEGYAEATYGDYDLIRLRAGVRGPVVRDRLYASLSASYVDRGGYVDNLHTGNDVNTEGNWGLRAKFVLDASEDLRLTAAFDYREVDQTTRTYDIAGYNNPPGGPLSLFQPNGPALVDADPFDRTISQDFEGVERLESFGASLTADLSFDGIAVKSITAVRTHDYFQSYDADNTEVPITIREAPEEMDSFMQEIRVSSENDNALQWIVGATYYTQETVNEFSSQLNNETLVSDDLLATIVGLPAELLIAFGVLIPPFGDTRSVGETDLDSLAGYANITYRLTERLQLNAGIRYTREEKSIAYVQDSPPANQFFGLPQIPFTEASTTFDATTPAIGLDFAVTDDILTYAKASRGFKSGGFNDSFASSPGDLFDQETLWNYEVGLKSTFWNQRARFNMALYRMDWKDVQSVFNEVPPGSFVPLAIIDTIADIETTGVEAELVPVPVEALRLEASVGVIDAEYTNPSARAIGFGVASGQSVESVPPYTLSGGFEYTFGLQEAGDLTLAAHAEYRDETPLASIQTGVANVQDAYGLIDASLTYRSADAQWSLQFWCKNLTDEEYVTAQFTIDSAATSPISAVYHSLGAPRTWGLEARYTF